LETGLERISQLVRENPERKLQTLMHNVSVETLRAAHQKQQTGKAAGVDRVTKQEYERDLEANLEDLIRRMRSFSYRPQPVRRTYIPKGDGRKRPLGIPAYEDKLVQGAMAEVLIAIYEPKFCDVSYGYRPGRSCHDAIRRLDGMLFRETNWVVDVDIKGFFDNVNHEWLMKFLENDIADKNFLRYIKRFLIAGIMEAGEYQETDQGVPQGGLISPVLANVYLHYAVDTWFETQVKIRYEEYAGMIRYADDMVFCFGSEREARHFYAMLKERLAEFGLELSEEKSKIIPFHAGGTKPKERFDFLGFTFQWGKTYKGKWTVMRRTSKKKLKTKFQAVKLWLRENRHQAIKVLVERLNLKLIGHYRYYGVTGNYRSLMVFYRYTIWQLRRSLRRRSQRDKTSWERFQWILDSYPIAQPKIYVRFA